VTESFCDVSIALSETECANNLAISSWEWRTQRTDDTNGFARRDDHTGRWMPLVELDPVLPE
jgi:hypothetical protein